MAAPELAALAVVRDKDRGLAGASTAVGVLAALLLSAVVLPGIMPWSTTVAVILVLGLIAAVYRTVTRPPLLTLLILVLSIAC